MRMVLVLLLIITYASFLQAQNVTGPVCLKEEFSCHDGTCISDSLLCNGVPDCANGLDEVVCITRPMTGCPPNERQCGNTNDCYRLGRECDGVRDCFGGEDERNCSKRQDSPCLVSQFECLANVSLGGSSVSTCIPLRSVCDCSPNCDGGIDEVNCAPPSFIMQPSLEEMVHAEGNVALLCTVEGYPTPTVTWLKNMGELAVNSRYNVISNNGSGVLYISNVSVFDEGSYSCVATQSSNSIISSQSTKLTVIEPNRTKCEAVDGGQFTKGQSYYNMETILTGQALFASADITFIVDESASMIRAHEWIRDVVPRLDNAIKGIGVGVGNRPNLYALVGFGRVSSPQGIVLTQLTSVQSFINATNSLATNGLREDGYSAIFLALDNITHRVNTSKIFVLVTNEERQPVRSELDRALVERRLRENNITLNSVVRQGFLYDSGDNDSFAFGLTSNRTAFSINATSSSGFRTHQNGIKHPNPLYSSGNTYRDYVELAFSVGGASWYIDFITSTNAPFTNAFIQVKIDELMLEKRCLQCTCGQGCQRITNVPLDVCFGLTSSLRVRMTPSSFVFKQGSNLTLTCRAFPIPSNLTLTYMFFGLRGDLCTTRAVCYNDTAIITNLTVSDAGVYNCRVQANNSLSGISGSFITVLEPPTAMISVSGQLRVDKPFTITCTGSGSRSPLIRWDKVAGSDTMSSNPRVQGTRGTSQLFFSSALSEHSGTYQCTVINCVGQASTKINITVTYTNCNLPDGSQLNAGETSVILYTPTLGADIILLVDESGSMVTRHKWITNMTVHLNDILRRINIGVTEPNLFGVVGFGSRYPNGQYSRIIEYKGQQFVNATNVGNLLKELSVDGKFEDGYAAIHFAISQYKFRENAATQFILISDENRDILQSDLNSSNVLSLLKEQDAILNVAISESFETIVGQQALGIDSTNRTFLFNPFNSLDFVTGGRAMKDSSHSTTNMDYTQLALSTGGAAWDLSVLTEGGTLVKSFTEAFVTVKANEIFQQVSNCLNCSCNSLSGSNCVRLPLTECNLTEIFMSLSIKEANRSIEVTVYPSRQMHIGGVGEAILTCSISEEFFTDDIQWTYNGGRSLPLEAVVSANRTVSILTLSPVLTNHKGSYTCIVRRGDQSGSASGLIEVVGQTLISISPNESHIITGNNHSVTCNASRTGGNITWLFNYNPLLPPNVIVTSIDSTLSILTITQANSSNIGRYTCNVQGAMVKSSTDALVYVSDPDFVVTVDPNTVQVNVGAMALLTCKVDCCKGANLTWQKSNGQMLSSRTMVISANNGQELILKFTNATLEDCDTYVCQADFNGDTRYGVSILQVIEPFRVSLNTNSSVSLYSGLSEYSISCHAIGDQATSWQWTFNATTNLTRVTNFGGRRSILVMCDLSLADTGLYTCTAIAANGMIAAASTFIQVVCNDTDDSCQSISSSIVSQVTYSSYSSLTETLASSSVIEFTALPSRTESTVVPSPTKSTVAQLPTKTTVQSLSPTKSTVVQSPLSTLPQSPSRYESTVTQSPSVAESTVAQSPSLTASTIAPSPSQSKSQSPSVAESTVAQSPSLTASTIVQSPSQSKSQSPLVAESTVAQSPSLTASTIAQSPSRSELTIAQSPSVAESTVAQSPSLTASTIAQSPSRSELTIAQSPSVAESTVAQSPSLTASTIAQSPSRSELTIAQSPSVAESTVAQSPSLTASTIAQSPSQSESTIAQLPSLSKSTVIQSSSPIVSTISQSPSQAKSTIVQSPLLSESTVAQSSLPNESTLVQSPSPAESTVAQSSLSTKSTAVQSRSLTNSAVTTHLTEPPVSTEVPSPSPTKSFSISFSTSQVSSIIVMPSSVSEQLESTFVFVTPTPTRIPLRVFISSNPRAYVLPGTNYNTTCTANRPDASVKWIYPNTSNVMVVPVNQTTLLLKIDSFTLANIGSYRCEATVDNGTLKESRVVDLFDGTLRISVEFESHLLDPGDNLNVTCSTSIPVENLTWIYLALRDQAVKLPNNIISNRTGNKTAILQISNFDGANNHGAYQCAAEEPGYTSVSKQIQINQRDSLNISTRPESYLRGASDAVLPRPLTYTCTVTCTCGGAYVAWSSPTGRSFPSHVTLMTDVTRRKTELIFNKLQVSDSGTYSCTITHRTGILTKNVTLTVLPPPELNVLPVSVSLPRGANFTFTCISNRAATFAWNYRATDGKLPNGAMIQRNKTNSTYSEILITNIQQGINTGAYYCHALFETGDSVTDTGNLVQQSIASIKFNPQPPQTFRVGDSISIVCELQCACGGFEPRWINLPTGLSYQLDASRRRSTLYTSSATIAMTGVYTCELVRRGVIEVISTYSITVM